jgi:pimeloyl-ACP methyl ester carboxylesterase
MAMHRRRLSRDEARGYLFPYDSWGSRVAIHRFILDIPMRADHPSRPALEGIARALPQFADRPGLILWGGRDFCFHDFFLGRWREFFPDYAWERYPDVGHYVLEDAGAAARGRIRAFLESR